MLKQFIFLLFCSHCLWAGPILKERFLQAQKGDYIVTSQNKHYSMLILQELSHKQLTLEEITIPASSVSSKISWKDWQASGALGHTARVKYVFDLEKNALVQCYSYTQKQQLYIDQSDYLLAQLLILPFQPTREEDRKRIGPPPLAGEPDRRKLWLPSLIRNGKKISPRQFEVVKAKWPKDYTRMANCDIELYLDAEHRNFPFPYWLEIQSSHYTCKIQTIDSGRIP